MLLLSLVETLLGQKIVNVDKTINNKLFQLLFKNFKTVSINYKKLIETVLKCKIRSFTLIEMFV